MLIRIFTDERTSYMIKNVLSVVQRIFWYFGAEAFFKSRFLCILRKA